MLPIAVKEENKAERNGYSMIHHLLITSDFKTSVKNAQIEASQLDLLTTITLALSLFYIQSTRLE